MDDGVEQLPWGGAHAEGVLHGGGARQGRVADQHRHGGGDRRRGRHFVFPRLLPGRFPTAQGYDRRPRVGRRQHRRFGARRVQGATHAACSLPAGCRGTLWALVHAGPVSAQSAFARGAYGSSPVGPADRRRRQGASRSSVGRSQRVAAFPTRPTERCPGRRYRSTLGPAISPTRTRCQTARRSRNGVKAKSRRCVWGRPWRPINATGKIPTWDGASCCQNRKTLRRPTPSGRPRTTRRFRFASCSPRGRALRCFAGDRLCGRTTYGAIIRRGDLRTSRSRLQSRACSTDKSRAICSFTPPQKRSPGQCNMR